MLIAQSFLTLCDPMFCPWNSPGKSTGVGSHSFLQGIFLTQGLNPHLLHCRQILYHLSYQGSPKSGGGEYLSANLEGLCLRGSFLQDCTTWVSTTSDQIRSDQSLSRVWLLATPWIAARQASLSITNSRSSLRLHVHRVSDAIQPPHPLSSPSPPAPNPSQHQSLLQWVNSAWGGQNTGVSALASFLPKKSQGWSPS